MLTSILVIAGAWVGTIGTIALTSDGNEDYSGGEVANNPFSEWEFYQPYNP